MSTHGNRLLDAITVAVAVGALILVGVVVVERRTEASSPRVRSPTTIEAWQDYAAVGHRQGREDAPVTVVVFNDYECPACRGFERTLRSIKAAHPDDLAVVHRYWPLQQHRLAYPAARAAESAGEQGRFHVPRMPRT